MSDRPNKLFHVLVVVGASMTGGACGGATSALPPDPDAARDAGADARDAAAKDAAADQYDAISPPPCGSFGAPGQCDAGYPTIVPNLDGGTDAYGQISPTFPDSGESDGYPTIVPNLDSGHDAYWPISPPPLDSGDLDGYAAISPNH